MMVDILCIACKTEQAQPLLSYIAFFSEMLYYECVYAFIIIATLV